MSTLRRLPAGSGWRRETSRPSSRTWGGLPPTTWGSWGDARRAGRVAPVATTLHSGCQGCRVMRWSELGLMEYLGETELSGQVVVEVFRSADGALYQVRRDFGVFREIRPG